jgi:RNA polymerase sigma factor (sigma-70 family)
MEQNQATPGEAAQAASMNWIDLVNRIRSEDPAAMEELYRLFSRGIRFYLCRQLGPQELDDKVHDTYLIVVQAIRRGDLREPDRLMGFIRTVVKRQVAATIEQNVQKRREMQGLEQGSSVSDLHETPEEQVILSQRAEIMDFVLRSLAPRDREILTRFYLQEQSQEEICAEMNITDTQFRLLKSRAKARFGEMGRRRLARRFLSRLFVRKSVGNVH